MKTNKKAKKYNSYCVYASIGARVIIDVNAINAETALWKAEHLLYTTDFSTNDIVEISDATALQVEEKA